MKGSKGKYVLKIDGNQIEVSKRIYDEYYRLRNREIYLSHRDRKEGLLHYDAWDTEQSNGCYDLVVDIRFDTEERAIERIERSELWNIVNGVQDKYKICYFISRGYTEREIAEIYGVSQIAIHKQKKKIFKVLKKIFK